MKRRLPPLTWLRAFEASARHLSFTHAAEELNLTQAAISKQVKSLEHYLREPMFHRKPRSLVLTKIGAAYLPKVRDSFERLSAGTEEVFGHRRSETLTVRATTGFSVNWLGPRLGKFYEQYPNIPLRIVSSIWNEEIDRESYDLDILYGTGKWPGSRADRLTWESLTPLCSPDLVKGDNAITKPDDLKTQNLLHVLGYEEGWALWLKKAGVKDINSGQGIQFDTSLVAFEMAATGHGVALGRTSMSGPDLLLGRLVQPFDITVPIDEAFYMVSPADGVDHPDAETFRQWILAEAGTHPEETPTP